MKKSWPRVIRDPVHNLINFDGGEIDQLLFDLISSREFQRLRRIKQLGLSEMVFPGANHSRFAHSIGVMHIARHMLDGLERTKVLQITEKQRVAVLAAALLHDIGHGPFSHAFEKVTNDNHEARTIEIIVDPSTEVNKILTRFDKELPDKLRIFFEKDLPDEFREKAGIPHMLTNIISSQLDADRADYLLRDSYTTGTQYGNFDLNWLLLQQKADHKKDRLCVGKKASIAAESYVLARFHMYQVVYYHKTTRAAEVMLKLLFNRYVSLLKGEGGKKYSDDIAPGAPSIVLKAFSGENISLQDYLSLDDSTITEFFKSCTKSSDIILSQLGDGILNRNLYKGIDLTGVPGNELANFVSMVRQALKEKGVDDQYYFVEDSAADTPYKPYDPDDEYPATEIYLETEDGGSKEISKTREVLKELKNRYTLLRYFFPEHLRGTIEEIRNKTLLKGAK